MQLNRTSISISASAATTLLRVPPRTTPTLKVVPLAEIAHRVKPFSLTSEFQNSARARFGIQASMRSNPMSRYFPHAHTFARRFYLASRSGRLKHQRLRRAPRFFLHKLATSLASASSSHVRSKTTGRCG